ncbi:hypothetical protein GpartN1_g4446.t1 [Galdieria partita]|uniref:Uncharacterized protein n=1 Tax=Galdieria partita TaxID=83374 RepID=A0A9C7URI4_9RHOD|nr:hypothetical protein GpartN1_g4446.t1 [Galdieria partita]
MKHNRLTMLALKNAESLAPISYLQFPFTFGNCNCSMKNWTSVFFLLAIVSTVSSIYDRQREELFPSRLPHTAVKTSDNEEFSQQYHTSVARVSDKLVPFTSDENPIFVSEGDLIEPVHRHEDDEEMDDGTEAFVTSVETNEDVIDACVLARSIRSHFGGSRDMVAIVLGSKGDNGLGSYPEDRQKNWNTLKNCGWEVLKFSLPSNQYIIRKRRLEWLRIHCWALTEYKAVVYMEPNSLVISPSVEEMFRCGCFCSSIYKGDYFEPDVMGLRPDASVYEHMLSTLEANTLGKKPQLVPWFNTYFKDLLMKPYFPLKVPAETIRCFSCEVKYFSICMRRLPVGYNADPVSHGIFLNSRLLRYKFSSLKPYKWWSAIFLSSHSRKIYLHYKRQVKNVEDINGSFRLICLFRVSFVASISLFFKNKWKCNTSNRSLVRRSSTLLTLFLSYLFGPIILLTCIATSWLLVPHYCEYITGTLCFNALFIILYFSLTDLIVHIYFSVSSCYHSQEETVYDNERCLGISVPWMQLEENCIHSWLSKLKILFITTFCIVPHIFIRFTRNIKVLVAMFVAYLLIHSFLSQLFFFLRCEQLLCHKIKSKCFDRRKETCFEPDVVITSNSPPLVTKKMSATFEIPRYNLKHLNRLKIPR